MPSIKQIFEMMEAQKTPYIRIWTTNRERLYTFENPTVEETKQQMETLMPFISSYGKVVVEAADENMKKRSYQSAYKWNLEFDKPQGTASTVAGPGHYPWQQMPREYMHQDVVAAQLAQLNARFDYEKELRKLQDQIADKNSQDPIKIIEKVAPVLMYMTGKPVEEIAKLSALYTNPAAVGSGAIRGPVTHTLVLKDVQDMTPDARKAKCQELADELAKYVSLEEMIILQSKLIAKLKENPQFMQTIFIYI